MAQFQYVGRDRSGKTRKGKIMSNSRKEAILDLRKKGIAVSEIVETPETIWSKDISIGSPVKNKDFVVYIRQFATLLRAGVTVVEATKILAQQTESKPLQRALFKVEEEIRSGKPLSEAAAMHDKIFSPMFVNLVKAGEATGNLDETLDRLASYFEKQHYSMQKVKSALTYPIAVAFIAVGVVFYLLVSVVPTFVNMFEQFNAELPGITQFVISLSEGVKSYWWILLLFIIALVLSLVMIARKPSTKIVLDRMLLKIPLFGKLIQKSIIARMTRTLSSLIRSSVPIMDAMNIVERVVNNEVLAEVIRESKVSLQRGQALSDPMRNSWIFPPLVTQMIAIGEQSGSLDIMLEKVADFYEQEVENTADSLKSLIEPIMIVSLAGVVGLIVLSIIVPMFEIFDYIQ